MGLARWHVMACLGASSIACSSGDDVVASGGGVTTSVATAAGGASSGGGSSSAGPQTSTTAATATTTPTTTGGTSTTGTSSVGGSSGGATTGVGGDTVSMGGAGGSGGAFPEVCSFDILGTLSEEIPTVGVVEWSTDLEGVTEARIEFSLDDPKQGELNVGSGGPISVSEPRALLLGLKPQRSYTYRIVVSAGETVCTSPDQQLVTEADPEAELVTRVAGAGGTPTRGFIVTCAYGRNSALIVDTDGDVVWSAEAPPQCSRALMAWDGEYLWMLKANPTYDDAGEVRRVRMDGSGAEQIPDLQGSHHDFAVLPEGTLAFLVWADDADSSSDVVERSPDGTVSFVVRLDSATFLPAFEPNAYHANALRYYANDDSYTVSDLAVGSIAKLDREGQISWQLRGNCTNAPPSQCAAAPLLGNHGHQLLEDGNLLVFFATNGSGRPVGDPAPIDEYEFDQDAGTLTATLAWSHVGEAGSMILGDVQRLPNGNTLVTYSMDASIHEVSPAGDLVQSLSASGQLGYASFRETLYGPPQ